MKDAIIMGEKIKIKLGTSEQNEKLKNYCERNVTIDKITKNENQAENKT